MNEHTPTITDQEINAFFSSTDQEQEESLRIDEIDQDLWDAVNTREIDTFTSPDETLDEALYDQLYDYAIANNLVGYSDDVPEGERAYATEKWVDSQRDFEHQLLERLRLCMYVQRYPSDEITIPNNLKKHVMAEFCAAGVSDSKWFQLVDDVLDGEPLDESQSDDFELAAEALETSSLLAARQQQLQRNIQLAFGAPVDDVGNLPVDYNDKKLARWTEVALQIKNVIVAYAGSVRQPDRYAAIDEICRTFRLHLDAPCIERLRQLSDEYTPRLP